MSFASYTYIRYTDIDISKCKEIPIAHHQKVAEELEEGYKEADSKQDMAWFTREFLPGVRERYVKKNVCPHCEGEGILIEPVKEVRFGNLLPRNL